MRASQPAIEAVRKGNARGSGYEKVVNNWYIEPISAVVALLGAERFWGTIVDPCCGKGTIPTTCRVAGLDCRGFDLVNRGYSQDPIDFFTSDYSWADHIICNPPFDLLEKFVLKAIGEAKHKVAVLVRLSWLESDGRYKRIFEPYPPAHIWVFRNRISCPPGGTDIPAKGGAVAYAWVVWNKEHRGQTTLDWIKA